MFRQKKHLVNVCKGSCLGFKYLVLSPQTWPENLNCLFFVVAAATEHAATLGQPVCRPKGHRYVFNCLCLMPQTVNELFKIRVKVHCVI